MKRIVTALLTMTFAASAAWGEPPSDPTGAPAGREQVESPEGSETTADAQTPQSGEGGEAEKEAKAEKAVQGAKGEKVMSGMSVVGNDEAPKSLVIVPWKSSDMGDTLDVSRALDDSLQPVDREVFMRELDYYAIRVEPGAAPAAHAP